MQTRQNLAAPDYYSWLTLVLFDGCLVSTVLLSVSYLRCCWRQFLHHNDYYRQRIPLYRSFSLTRSSIGLFLMLRHQPQLSPLLVLFHLHCRLISYYSCLICRFESSVPVLEMLASSRNFLCLQLRYEANYSQDEPGVFWDAITVLHDDSIQIAVFCPQNITTFYEWTVFHSCETSHTAPVWKGYCSAVAACHSKVLSVVWLFIFLIYSDLGHLLYYFLNSQLVQGLIHTGSRPGATFSWSFTVARSTSGRSRYWAAVRNLNYLSNALNSSIDFQKITIFSFDHCQWMSCVSSWRSWWPIDSLHLGLAGDFHAIAELCCSIHLARERSLECCSSAALGHSFTFKMEYFCFSFICSPRFAIWTHQETMNIRSA